MTRVVVAGMGHVGIVTAAGFAELGHEVVGIDTDAARIALLRAGHVPIFEPGLDALVRRGVEVGRLTFTDSYGACAESDVVFLAVSTPTSEDGVVDLGAVRGAAQAVINALPGGALPVIVVKSTCPVGTAGALLESLMVAARRPVSLAVNPEFLSQGTAVRDVLHPDRIVIGASDEHAASVVAAVHAGLDAPIVRTDLRTAELVKYAANAFLGTKISFINELAALCDVVQADIVDVATGIGLDPRIGPAFLRAGVGFGGSCLPKDLRTLAFMGREHALPMHMTQAALTVNTDQRDRVIAYLRQALGALDGSTIAALGLSFKPETDDLREAPALELIRMCAREGAHIQAYDPEVAVLPGADAALAALAADAYAAAAGADAVLLTTEWPAFMALDLARLRSAMRGDVLFDLRNVLDPTVCRAAGFRYRGVGRAAATRQNPSAK